MKKIILFVLTFFTLISAHSIELSDRLKVSVLTVSPGNELYSIFGHSAIRVKDVLKGYDLVFNYGTFDFQTSNFYLKFILGKLDYMLSVEPFDDFMAANIEEQRTVIEQTLNFNKFQSLLLAQLLINNYRPENRYYRYKFFTDNCSTRIRDILTSASGDSSLLEKPKAGADQTFRELYSKYLEKLPWTKFGIEFLMGRLADEEAGYNSLFLPDYLKMSIGHATLGDKQLVASESVIFNGKLKNIQKIFFTPTLFAIIILFLTFIVQLKKNLANIFDRLFFLISGLLGIFIFLVCTFSSHNELQNNFAIVFFIPINIILPFLPKSSFRKYYCVSALSLIVLGLIILPFQSQYFSYSFLLIITSLSVRLYFNILNFK